MEGWSDGVLSDMAFDPFGAQSLRFAPRGFEALSDYGAEHLNVAD